MVQHEKTCELIAGIRKILHRDNITQRDFALSLNKYLSPRKRIVINESTSAQLCRWFAVGKDHWCPPTGDILLAFQKWHDKNL